MPTPSVHCQIDDGLATLTLDDGKVNVLGPATQAALNTALDAAAAADAALLILGRPNVFCGGFDLAVFRDGGEALAGMLEGGARLSRRLLGWPRPVVTACAGPAVAMGAFLLLSGDWRLGGTAGTRPAVNEVAIGLTLPRFATEVCRLRLTPSALQRAPLAAEPVSPAQALADGFVDELVPDAELLGRARDRARRLAALPADHYAGTKRRLRAPALAALDAAIAADVADWRARTGVAGGA